MILAKDCISWVETLYHTLICLITIILIPPLASKDSVHSDIEPCLNARSARSVALNKAAHLFARNLPVKKRMTNQVTSSQVIFDYFVPLKSWKLL